MAVVVCAVITAHQVGDVVAVVGFGVVRGAVLSSVGLATMLACAEYVKILGVVSLTHSLETLIIEVFYTIGSAGFNVC